jgi:hypothetical protein
MAHTTPTRVACANFASLTASGVHELVDGGSRLTAVVATGRSGTDSARTSGRYSRRRSVQYSPRFLDRFGRRFSTPGSRVGSTRQWRRYTDQSGDDAEGRQDSDDPHLHREDTNGQASAVPSRGLSSNRPPVLVTGATELLARGSAQDIFRAEALHDGIRAVERLLVQTAQRLHQFCVRAVALRMLGQLVW